MLFFHFTSRIQSHYELEVQPLVFNMFMVLNKMLTKMNKLKRTGFRSLAIADYFAGLLSIPDIIELISVLCNIQITKSTQNVLLKEVKIFLKNFFFLNLNKKIGLSNSTPSPKKPLDASRGRSR